MFWWCRIRQGKGGASGWYDILDFVRTSLDGARPPALGCGSHPTLSHTPRLVSFRDTTAAAGGARETLPRLPCMSAVTSDRLDPDALPSFLTRSDLERLLHVCDRTLRR